MKVAFNISPVRNGHRVRGIGSYTQNLLSELQKQPKIKIIPFDDALPTDADIIHYPYFDLFFQTLPTKSKIKRVVTIHDVIPLVFPEHFPSGIRGSINLFLQKNALKNVDAIICDSETSKKDVTEKLSYAREKIHVVYLAPGSIFKKINDKSKLSKITEQFNLPRKFLLYVGDVNWNKNLKNLLEAVKIAKCNIVMVGKSLIDLNIPQSKEIEKQIKDLKIEKNVKKTGYVSDENLVAIYNLAKVTILPSHYEGFGLSVLESMACGTPVICSNNSSLSEINGNLAMYCDPESPEDIAQKISEALNSSEEESKSLSSNLIEHASTFTWRKAAKETIKVYENISK